MVGKNVSQHPEEAQAIVRNGFQIASHSNDHSDLTTLSKDDLVSNLSQSFNMIHDTTGVQTSILRAPYGHLTTDVVYKSNALVSLFVQWDFSTIDWNNVGSDQVAKTVIENAKPGSIVLMHDMESEEDIVALPQILNTLTNQGYRFVTIDELIASDSNIPNDIFDPDYKPVASDQDVNLVWPK